jgi:hypothetical protein
MIQIQRHLIIPTFKEQFFMKEGDKKSVKITKAKYEKLYDESWSNDNIKVLAPITKELRYTQR